MQPAVLSSLLQLYLLTFHPSNPPMVMFLWAFAEAVFSSCNLLAQVNLMNYSYILFLPWFKPHYFLPESPPPCSPYLVYLFCFLVVWVPSQLQTLCCFVIPHFVELGVPGLRSPRKNAATFSSVPIQRALLPSMFTGFSSQGISGSSRMGDHSWVLEYLFHFAMWPARQSVTD